MFVVIVVVIVVDLFTAVLVVVYVYWLILNGLSCSISKEPHATSLCSS